HPPGATSVCEGAGCTSDSADPPSRLAADTPAPLSTGRGPPPVCLAPSRSSPGCEGRCRDHSDTRAVGQSLFPISATAPKPGGRRTLPPETACRSGDTRRAGRTTGPGSGATPACQGPAPPVAFAGQQPVERLSPLPGGGSGSPADAPVGRATPPGFRSNRPT